MLEIKPIPAFADNYIWLVHNHEGGPAVVVDPGDEEPVLSTLSREGLRLAGILVTHHHGDHTGGIGGLVSRFPGIPVVGPGNERIAGVTRPVVEGERVRFAGIDAELRVLEVPGHTMGHVAYYGEGSLFCGDTLFAAGCGRVFGGTLEALFGSLQRIKGLPGDTLVYCAHEYTLDNLGFAKWVEPGNPEIAQREALEQGRRRRGEPTVPSRLATELVSNPFLRTDVAEVRRAAEAFAGRSLAGEAEVFAAIRTWKDRDYD